MGIVQQRNLHALDALVEMGSGAVFASFSLSRAKGCCKMTQIFELLLFQLVE